MKIGIVVFDGFTDLDFYLPWDLLNRVRLLNLNENWQVEILCNEAQVYSAAGLALSATQPYSFSNNCDAVLFCSGPKTRDLIKDNKFLEHFNLDLKNQFIAAIDSGALILGALGLLKNKRATTYPTAFDLLSEFGAIVEKNEPFMSEGNIATAARCLSGDKLAFWIIEKLVGLEVSKQVFDSVRPLSL